MNDPVISQWVYDAIEGDQNAFAEIVYTFQDAVYNLCYRMLGEHTEAEDATQEALLRAYSHLRRYDHNRAFKTWILTIASNHCIDRLRKRRIQYFSIDDPLPGGALTLKSEAPQPEHMVMIHERSQDVQALLEQLAPDYRQTVILRYWYEYSYAEIAEIMQTTESAIKSRLFRARHMLADMAQDTRGQDIGSALEERFDDL